MLCLEFNFSVNQLTKIANFIDFTTKRTKKVMFFIQTPLFSNFLPTSEVGKFICEIIL